MGSTKIYWMGDSFWFLGLIPTYQNVRRSYSLHKDDISLADYVVLHAVVAAEVAMGGRDGKQINSQLFYIGSSWLELVHNFQHVIRWYPRSRALGS